MISTSKKTPRVTYPVYMHMYLHKRNCHNKPHYNQHDIIVSFAISEKCQDRVYNMNFVLAHKDDFFLKRSPGVPFFTFLLKL